ncbi:hypothetical protein D9611_013511 [Ephemerocybe angulata]|uniref:Uncharacterized protein n=1 Tax=Ephemerocybe angulata TaxID=980116 RepID=A0A8H5BV53_9AGAR|nr:hypothetical protein D9611_013511 [Tulosesus angulatus]
MNRFDSGARGSWCNDTKVPWFSFSRLDLDIWVRRLTCSCRREKVLWLYVVLGCLVEVECSPNPVASCAMPAMPGAKIWTNTPLVHEAREVDVVRLRPHSFPRNHRKAENKNSRTWVAAVEEFGTTGHGNDMQIGTYVARTMDSELSGNILDLYPIDAGHLADTESLVALKDLVNRLGSDNLALDQVHGVDVRSNYLFNSTIPRVEEADAILLLGTSSRHEAAVLISRIRKSWLHTGLEVFGERSRTTCGYEHIGIDAQALTDFITGKRSFSAKFKLRPPRSL